MVTTVKKGSKPNNEVIDKTNNNRPFPASKFAGKIKAKKNPVKLQKHLRDEWNKSAG
ncbi:hypothetical protein BH23BAC3_BH23BAC3_10810 [soil metagenome]